MIETLFESVANGALAVLGISFLIFIHEAGHFLAARLFDVRVETFSIGFGPRIFGWRRGTTDYRISAIPLGGYVKMAGEYGDLPDDVEPDPGDLMGKPIWQRFVIFSAGVVVNIAFAFILFPVAFGAGLPFMAPVIGDVTPGGPAWKAGLQPGDEILAVNGSRVWGFPDVSLEVALSDPEDLVLEVRRQGAEFSQPVIPQRTEGRYEIGIRPEFLPALEVEDDSPAFRNGLRTGDELLAINEYTLGDESHGRIITPAVALRLSRDLYGKDALTMLVEREGREMRISHLPELIDEPEEGGRRVLGAVALRNRVAEVRGRAASPSFPLRIDDVLLGSPGHPVLSEDDFFALLARGAPLELNLQRSGQELAVRLDDADIASLRAGDLVLQSDLESPRILVPEGGALYAAGLRDGDRLMSVDDTQIVNFRSLLDLLESTPDVVDREVSYERDGAVSAASVRGVHPPVFKDGFTLELRQVVYDLDLAASLGAGIDACLNALRNTGLTLGKVFTGEVSADNLGGPVEISRITYRSAERDIAELIFFLALLSVNLGIINILPIPVLDGGQVMFLLFEKVKGRRLSERFLQNAQLTGLVAILALMAYVTFNDFARLVG